MQSDSDVCRKTPQGLGWRRQASYPDMPSAVPLLYVLTMKACLSDVPHERPSFEDILTLLTEHGGRGGGRHVHQL